MRLRLEEVMSFDYHTTFLCCGVEFVIDVGLSEGNSFREILNHKVAIWKAGWG
jgi:hypothetical protein